MDVSHWTNANKIKKEEMNFIFCTLSLMDKNNQMPGIVSSALSCDYRNRIWHIGQICKSPVT